MAEAQAAEEARRRDPVKLGIWIAIFCVAVVGLWIADKQFDIYFAKSHLTNLTDTWNRKKAQFDLVTTNQDTMAKVDEKLAALDRLSTNRFLWGSVLNALQMTVVDHVQVIHFRGDQSYTTQDSSFVGTGSTKRMIPGGVTENIKLTIDGRDFAPSDAGYSKYKDLLCNFPFFVQKLGSHDGFILEGTLGQLSVDPQNARTFQNFTLATHLPPVTRADQ
jgi:hypothetical protein